MIQWQIDTAAGKSIDGTTTLQKLGFRIEGEARERTGERSGVGAPWAPPHEVFGISNSKSFNLVLCIVKRVILQKTTFQRKHRKIFRVKPTSHVESSNQNWGSKVGGILTPDPPPPSGCALDVFHGITRARFVVKPGGVSTECLTKLEGVNYNLGLKKP